MRTDTITTLDGVDLAGTFSVCLHAPIGSESGDGRNDRSLAFQVALENGPANGKALFLGDLGCSAIRRIFDCGDPRTLVWDVLLAPHHCSKSAMFVKDEQSGHERLREDILRDIATAARRPAYIVSSSRPVPASNGPGEDPPHSKAKAQYERILGSEFLCTHEHPNTQSPEPVMFEVSTSGFRRFQPHRPSKSLGSLLKSARGFTRPPAVPIGFGCDDE